MYVPVYPKLTVDGPVLSTFNAREFGLLLAIEKVHKTKI